MAEVEGDCLGFGRQSLPASDEGLLAEEVPCGLVDAAGVGGLGVAEPIGDGLGRIMVAAQQLEVFLELGGGGEKGPGILFCFHGLGESPKLVITLYYHGFIWARNRAVPAHLN